MRYYSPKEFLEDTKKLSVIIKKFDPQVIVPIARGGLTLAHYLSELLDIRDVFCINSIGYDGEKKLDSVKVFNTPKIDKKRVLVVDDIADSGDTLKAVLDSIMIKNPHCEIKTATLFYKKSSVVQPDFTVCEATEWIEYFWNKELT